MPRTRDELYSKPSQVTNDILEKVWSTKNIRCDNGPEYISHALQSWAKKHKITLQYIQPGYPQQNAYIERYNRTVRYDWLNQHLFSSLDEVREYATKWLWMYNNERPHTAIGRIPPRQKVVQVA